MEERHLSLGEVAELLDKSERTVRRWIKSGKLKAFKPGRDYLIPESAIRELIERSEVYPKAQAPLFPQEHVEDTRRPDVVPALPEVEEWVRGLGPEAALIAMSDDEFYDHADDALRGDPFNVKEPLEQLELGRTAIENALKGSTKDMPEALRPSEPASDPEDRVYAAVRRRQPRRRVAQWARARAHVRALNLFEHVLRRAAAMPEEVRVEQLVEETAEKQT